MDRSSPGRPRPLAPRRATARRGRGRADVVITLRDEDLGSCVVRGRVRAPMISRSGPTASSCRLRANGPQAMPQKREAKVDGDRFEPAAHCDRPAVSPSWWLCGTGAARLSWSVRSRPGRARRAGGRAAGPGHSDRAGPAGRWHPGAPRRRQRGARRCLRLGSRRSRRSRRPARCCRSACRPVARPLCSATTRWCASRSDARARPQPELVMLCRPSGDFRPLTRARSSRWQCKLADRRRCGMKHRRRALLGARLACRRPIGRCAASRGDSRASCATAGRGPFPDARSAVSRRYDGYQEQHLTARLFHRASSRAA